MIFETDFDTSKHIAILTIRVVAGILFIAQGYDKLFGVGIKKVVESFAYSFTKIKIPVQVLRIAITLSSLIEFFGGIMLLAGFERDVVLTLLLFNMIGVCAGFCLIKPIWDMQHYFPRLILLLLILLLPPEWDAWRMDFFFR